MQQEFVFIPITTRIILKIKLMPYIPVEEHLPGITGLL
jgi:hypothetical protein